MIDESKNVLLKSVKTLRKNIRSSIHDAVLSVMDKSCSEKSILTWLHTADITMDIVAHLFCNSAIEKTMKAFKNDLVTLCKIDPKSIDERRITDTILMLVFQVNEPDEKDETLNNLFEFIEALEGDDIQIPFVAFSIF